MDKTREIIECYRTTGSLKAVRRELGISEALARRVLSAAGEYTSPTADAVRELQTEGKTIPEIAELLGLKPDYVREYTAFEKGSYTLTEDKTVNAQRIAACLSRKRERSE
jgi:DNA-directed RNA polymerase specialized sigma24 family protein